MVEVVGGGFGVNEYIGREYMGDEGCMISRKNTEAMYVRGMSNQAASRAEYLARAVIVDWGTEEGAGTWAAMAGLYETPNGHKWCLYDANSFQGDFDLQGLRACEWAVARGAQLLVGDYGYSAGRHRYFIRALGESNVILINHGGFHGKSSAREWTIAPMELFISDRIIRVPKSLAFDHLVGLLARTEDPPIRVPGDDREFWRPYIEHCHNIYRGRAGRDQRIIDGFESVSDEKEEFKKTGPIHFCDILKFLGLTLMKTYLRYIISHGGKG